MHIHYYLDTSLKVIKISGNLKNIKHPPKIFYGHPISESDETLSIEIEKVISNNNLKTGDFSDETPIYNIGVFEHKNSRTKAFYKLLKLSGVTETGILYLLEYSNTPNTFTLADVDHDVIESIELSRFRDVIKVSSIGILQIDDRWRTIYASKAWSEITGYSLTEASGRDWSKIIHPDDRNFFLETLYEHIKVEKNSDQDVRIITPEGDYRWLNIHYRVSHDSINNCSNITLLFLDIHNKRQSLEHLKQIATTDLLTRLCNRYAFQEALEKYVRQLHPNHSFHLLFIDLDGFKAVNDAYGHTVGDKLLAETARRILLITGPHSIVARLGGDEFAILRMQTSSPKIGAFANALLQEISKPYSLVENAQESYVSASIGIVAVSPGDISHTDALDPVKVKNKSSQLLRDADTAMYHAKEAGKNTYRAYAGTVNEEALKTQLLSDSLHRALEFNEFQLHYQPQWNVSTGELYGYEALIRWQKDNQYVSPASFIPLVESNGMMGRLGKWIFEQALIDHTSLLAKHNVIPQLSVNFSPIQFRDHKLSDFIEETIVKYQVPIDSITIEITESLLMSDYIKVKSQLTRLKSLGLKIALDDFGTGYSSLSMLHRFPIDIIKVDQSFIANLEEDTTQKIVRGIIKMSKELNKLILFEGVETEKQLSFLEKEDVEIIQGWLISRAIPISEMPAFIEAKEAVNS